MSREGLLAWDVKDKTFAWERPLRRGDLQALGDTYLDTGQGRRPNRK